MVKGSHFGRFPEGLKSQEALRKGPLRSLHYSVAKSWNFGKHFVASFIYDFVRFFLANFSVISVPSVVNVFGCGSAALCLCGIKT